MRGSPSKRDLHLSNIWIIERQNHPNHPGKPEPKYNFKGFISRFLFASFRLLQHVKDTRTEAYVISLLNLLIPLTVVYVVFFSCWNKSVFCSQFSVIFHSMPKLCKIDHQMVFTKLIVLVNLYDNIVFM